MSIVHALRLHEHLSEQASAWLSLGESEAHSFLAIRGINASYFSCIFSRGALRNGTWEAMTADGATRATGLDPPMR